MFRLRHDEVLAALEQLARRLLEERPEVLQVRLFGSLATGNAGPGSDADVLIVLRDAPKPFLERIPTYASYLTGAGVSCDIFPYTRTELARLRREGNRFAEMARRKSRLLAARPLRAARRAQT